MTPIHNHVTDGRWRDGQLSHRERHRGHRLLRHRQAGRRPLDAGSWDTVKIEVIEEDAPAPAERRCQECNALMTPAEGAYAVCRDCRLGPPDASLERAMTGIRTR